MFSVIKFLCCFYIFSLPTIAMEYDKIIGGKKPSSKRTTKKKKWSSNRSTESLPEVSFNNLVRSSNETSESLSDQPLRRSSVFGKMLGSIGIPKRSVSTKSKKNPLPFKKSYSDPHQKKRISEADSIASSFSPISGTSTSSINHNGDITRSSETMVDNEIIEEVNYESIMSTWSQCKKGEFNKFFTWKKFRTLTLVKNKKEIGKFKKTALYSIFAKLTKVKKELTTEYREHQRKRLVGQKLDISIWRLLNKDLLLEYTQDLLNWARTNAPRMNPQQHKETGSWQYQLLKRSIDAQNDVDAKIDSDFSLLDIAVRYDAPKPLIFVLSGRLNELLIDHVLLEREIHKIINEQNIVKRHARTELQKIIEDKPDAEIVKEIRKADMAKSINHKDRNGKTLAHYLLTKLRFTHPFLIQSTLSSARPNLNIYDNNGNSPLHEMVLTTCDKFTDDQGIELFKNYLEYAFLNGYDFSWKNDDGFTLLHLLARTETEFFYPINLFLALAKNYKEKIQIDLNALSFSGSSALYYAIENGFLEEALALIEAGANPWAGKSGKYPIQLVDRIIKTLQTTEPKSEALKAFELFRNKMYVIMQS